MNKPEIIKLLIEQYHVDPTATNLKVPQYK